MAELVTKPDMHDKCFTNADDNKHLQTPNTTPRGNSQIQDERVKQCRNEGATRGRKYRRDAGRLADGVDASREYVMTHSVAFTTPEAASHSRSTSQYSRLSPTVLINCIAVSIGPTGIGVAKFCASIRRSQRHNVRQQSHVTHEPMGR